MQSALKVQSAMTDFVFYLFQGFRYIYLTPSDFKKVFYLSFFRSHFEKGSDYDIFLAMPNKHLLIS